MTTTESVPAKADTGAANFALGYLLLMLLLFGWLLFDIWIDSHWIARFLGYPLAPLKTPFFHLIACTVIGGAIGGIVNGIRSGLNYYQDFQLRYFWKYIYAPWLGTALALIGFALLRSTVAIFGGEAPNTVSDTSGALANFAIGALAGYGARDVFTWLDEKVSSLFKVEKETPELTGELEPLAAAKIHAQNLTVGDVVTTPAETPEDHGRIVEQSPEAGETTESGQPVNMVVAVETNGKKPPAERKATRK